MLQNKFQAIPVSAADVIAIDALFKRIAERGRQIRMQMQADNSGAFGEPKISDETQSKRVSVESSLPLIGDEKQVLGM